ncbi:hydantoinase B/oxoprolinase family protein [Alphaproteobacteria bacterium]|nr:hydantoinase B/oxoprolinase family protein [Alphaproteobacteria bacterium]
MRKEAINLDPVTIEILSNGLQSVVDEAFIALMKSAYSTNIKERHDHSCAIVDRTGRLVAQAANSIPVHIASVLGQMQAIFKKFPLDEITEGDVFAANDPHEGGGTHLPDVSLAMPVFADGKLLGFVCNIAHHADIGGMSPGSMAGGMKDIYQEGLRIPVVKLFRKGKLDQDIFDILLLNVRVREERRGDYNAQFSALHLAARRLFEMINKYSGDLIRNVFNEIIDRTYERMLSAITLIPDGVYRFEDVMDDDGREAVNVPINLTATIKGKSALFDFAGTSPQTPGNINIPLHGTKAAVCYVLKAMLDPDIPNNQGVLDAVEVVAPIGTMVSCIAPASVAARAHTSQRIIDVVIGALSSALPEAAVGAANGANTMAVFAGTDPETGEPYVYLETLGGGFGGRNDRDGKDGVQVHITNTSNLPIEAIEMEYPLRVDRYGFIPDSGGAGQYRGGLGLQRVVRPIGHTCIFNGVGERFRNSPWGIFGGCPGQSGSFWLEEDQCPPMQLSHKPPDMSLKPNQALVVNTPGAGGYGDPKKRSKELIESDEVSGKFSDKFLRTFYKN